MAETLCRQFLRIKIAVYLFAQDQIASNCIKYVHQFMYVQVYPSCILCVQPCSRGASHRAEQGGGGGGWLYVAILSHTVKAYHLQQQLSPTYVTIHQLVRMHTLCKSIVYMCVHRRCQHSAEGIQRIITGKIIINYSYIIQWNLC